MTVGKQTSLTLSGPMASLTLAKELNDGVAVTLGATANVTTMTVDTPNPVAINGKVGTLKVTAAANITLAKGATVTKKDVTSKTAKITTSANAAVTAAPTAAATKPAATKPRRRSRRLFLRLHRLEGRLPRQDRFDLLGRG